MPISTTRQSTGRACPNRECSVSTAWMADSTINRLYCEGNVQTIMFPMENDSTYNKFSFTESSYMDAYFENGDIQRLIMWPETTGKVTPLYLAKRSSYYLPKFRWYGPLRPMSPDEVFDYPSEMDDLVKQNILGRMSKDALTMRGQATGKPAPKLPVMEPSVPALTDMLPEPTSSDSIPADSVPADSLMFPDSIPADITLPDSIAIPVQHPDSIARQGTVTDTPEETDTPASRQDDPESASSDGPEKETPIIKEDPITNNEEGKEGRS